MKWIPYFFGALLYGAVGLKAAEIQIILSETLDVSDRSVVLEWETIPEWQYFVEWREDLDDDGWKLLEGSEQVGDGGLARISLDEILSTKQAFFRVVEEQVNVSAPVFGIISPSVANVLVNDSIQLSAEFTENGDALWNVLGFDGSDHGSVSPTGIFTAPDQVPDIPFVQVTATHTGPTRATAFASITLVKSENDLFHSRAQAVDHVLRSVVLDHPERDRMVVFGTPEPLPAGSVLRPADASSDQVLSIAFPSWFFLIDLEPSKSWSHRVEFLLVNSQTGEVYVRNEHDSFPMVNDLPFWSTFQERMESPDRVYIGSEFLEMVQRETESKQAFNPAQAGEVEQTDPWKTGLEFPVAACLCDQPKSYAIVLANDAPSETATVRFGSEFGGLVTGASTEDRIRNGGLIFKDILTQSGFEVTSIIGARDYTTEKVGNVFSTVRKKLRPCDLLFVYVISHGSRVGAGKTGFSYEVYRDLFASMPTAAKYMVFDSCYSGNIIDRMNEGAQLVGRNRIGLNGFVLTSTDADNSTNALFYSKTFDSKGRRPLAFSNAFLTCMAAGTPFLQIPACSKQLDSLVSESNPLAASFTTPDSDRDGVPDDLEIQLALDPSNSDTDGDGVCDGVELGYAPFSNSGNLRIQPSELDDSAPVAGSLNAAYTYRFRTVDEIYIGQLQQELDPNERAAFNPSEEYVLFNDRPVAQDNPYGYGPNSGWSLKTGMFPSGLQLEQNGTLSGIPVETGEFNFTLVYMDPMGRTSELSASVIIRGSVESTSSIRVTTHQDGNTRDNELTLREAILLANGTLKLADLKPDPDPSDRIAEGELRWVTGDPGSNPVEIDLQVSEDFQVSAPLVVTADQLTIMSYSKVFRAAQGPVFDFRGSNARMPNIIHIEVGAGPGLVVGGTGNNIGGQRNHLSRPFFYVTGGGSGSGILVTGKGNVIGGAVIEGFENGLHFGEGAVSNVCRYSRLVGNQNGLVFDGGAHSNQVLEAFCGYQLDWESRSFDPLDQPNSGYGVWIRGAAKNNTIQSCGIAANLLGGIRISDTGTSGNQVVNCYVGSDQSFRLSSQRMASPNQGSGITISEGASDNLIKEGVVGENMGHGIVITGEQTSGNLIGQWGCRILELSNNQEDSEWDAIRIEAGAHSNRLAVHIKASSGNGIHMLGEGTVRNVVEHIYGNDVCSIKWSTKIEKCVLAGILIDGGAQHNVIGIDSFSKVSISECGTGIRMDGDGTEGNAVIHATISENTQHGIEITGGASFNELISDVASYANGGSGVLISGAGTEGNRLAQLGGLVPSSSFFAGNQAYAVEISGGASLNMLEQVTIYKHIAGGILVDGAGTTENTIYQSTVQGALFGDVSNTGDGIRIQGGAHDNLIIGSNINLNGKCGIVLADSNTQGNRVIDSIIRRNLADGILIDGAVGSRIGELPGVQNRIADNGGAGIRISGETAQSNSIVSNTIGNGGFYGPNASHGILIESGAKGNTVGGARPLVFDRFANQIRQPADPDQLGLGNLIVGNAGDGIRIDGAHENKVIGNLIGAAPTSKSFANTGHGIAVINGAKNNRIGNCLDDQNRDQGFSNYITMNEGDGIHLDGGETFGNTLRQNELVGNLGKRIVLGNGANGGIQPIFISRDGIAGDIDGVAPRSGIIDVYSDFPASVGVFHLTAAVRTGPFRVGLFDPVAQSTNVVLLDKGQDLRNGTILVTFTDRATGNTSAFAVFE